MPTLEEILKEPIDHKSPDVARLLRDLQGNILVGHGRDHSMHLFLQFGTTPEAVSTTREWIRKFADQYVTSAKKQLDERDDFRKFRISGDLFANFFLSYKGYETLGISATAPLNEKFKAGMRESVDLGDPEPGKWEEGYREKIHASILLAHDDERELHRKARRILQAVRQFASVVAGERGRVIRNSHCESIEHFGFVDGRSQPLFIKEGIQKELPDPLHAQYDPSAAPLLVLEQDPGGVGSASYGSYLVFRKLEQNVRGFEEARIELAAKLGLPADNQLADAMIIGRFKDGTPLVLSDKEKQTDPVPNDFNYQDDSTGLKCPFHSHVRKMNPRGEGEAEIPKEESLHRIARRGIPYGERCKEPKDNPRLEELPRKDVGLLFMCFQRNIGNQFEFLQKRWANRNDLPRSNSFIDPLIGQQQNPEQQKWPVAWGSADKREFLFHGFVTLKGGEYFFAPSISALRNI